MNVSPCCHKSSKFDINKCINALIIRTLMFSEAEVRTLHDDDEGNYVVWLVKHLTTVRSASPHSDDDDSAMISFILLLLSLDPDVDAITVVYKNVALRSCNTSWNAELQTGIKQREVLLFNTVIKTLWLCLYLFLVCLRQKIKVQLWGSEKAAGWVSE